MNKWQKLGFRKPQNKIEWTMWIGAGFILLAVIISQLFVRKPVSYSPQTFSVLHITNLLRDIGFGITASTILISGFIHLKIERKKARGYFGIIVGTILLMLMIGRPAFFSTMFSTMQAETIKNGNQLVEKLSDKLNKANYSPVENAHFRKSIAKEKYFQDGSLVDYLDVNGTTMKYSPTPEDIQNREMRITMARSIEIMRLEMIFWAIVFVAVLIGSINYIKRKQQN
jgi:hypothetical protein